MTTKTSTRFHLGTPQTTGPLTLYPIFGGESRLRYRSLGQAVKHGAFISEVHEHGSVNNVLVSNASDQPVLLYEGELIYGARQNRTIDAPVLVPAGVELSVSVSCIEQGRWDAGQHAAHFVPAPHAADPGLRSAKRAAANEQGEAGASPCPEQGEVWREVDERLVSHGVDSASAALSDIYDAKRLALADLNHAVHALDGQVGVVVEISGQPVALDLVGRSEVFADLLPRLANGYALQALGAPVAKSASDDVAQGFLKAVLSSRRRWLPNPGMGDSYALTRPNVHGCGLRAERELICLSAFPRQDG